ncbi:MAG: hypothetical protein OXC42_03160 [Gammaproteobacteria bacterium]|nr:hypothetical protein [Gammaproteobacteria bacterium]
MTAEVAVINKSAVAIAADSAVTTELTDSSGRRHDKIFNTANKVFALSKYAPVGIMVYNATELGGVPWETLIKEYRKDRGKKNFAHLEDYASDLFKFLSGNKILFNEKHIKDVLLLILIRYFSSLLGNEKTSNRKARGIFENKIGELENLEFADSFNSELLELPNDYVAVVDEAAKFTFGLPAIRNLKTKYRRLAALAITKEFQLEGYSGVVITGFGEEEVFPKLIEYKTDLVIFDRVRKAKLQEFEPSHLTYGKVMSFAQEDITRTILEGINPSYAKQIQNSAIEYFSNLPSTIIDDIDELEDDRKDHYKTRAFDAFVESIKDYFRKMNEERKSKHTFQIEKAIQMMPFSELAEIAEVFIRLTQVRRRLSPDSETVGGPIDVAVISKADGFVWIKRKYYFDKELNYSFMGNYLDKG